MDNIKIRLLRHGKTNGNLLKQYIGSTNEDLCSVGVKEIENAINEYKLDGFKPKIIYTSPLIRCISTLKLIYPNFDYIIANDLRESDFGEFEMKTYEELKDNYKYQKWLDSGGAITLFNGENTMDFKVRCNKVFIYILEDCINRAYENALIVCHGGTIMSILEKFSNKENSFYDWQIQNGNGFDIVVDTKTMLPISIDKIY